MKIQKILILILLITISCSNPQHNKNKAKKIETTSPSVKITSQQRSGYNIGAISSNFNLKNVDGKMVSLTNYKDAKGFIVVFISNHCPFSQAYEERIIDLDKKYRPKGYPVIAINPTNPEIFPTDSYENMKKLAKQKGFTFPFLFDPSQKISKQFGATNTPHVYVLEKTDKGNKVAYIGAIDDNARNASAVHKKYVEQAVNSLLAQKEPKITETRAIGCGIIYE